MPVTVEVQGLRELSERLRVLPLEIQKQIMVGAVDAGAQVIQREAERLAPKKRGFSSPKSLVSRIIRRRKSDAEVSEVQVSILAKAPHAHLVHFGTAAHEIRAKRKKVLADKAAGKIFGKTVKHPGAKAQPFLSRAFESKKREALDKIAAFMRDRLDAPPVTGL